MSQHIFLTNEYPGILDLSAINDVEGKRVLLQPKGMDGSERECFAEVEEHPHVQVFVTGGRLSIRRGSLEDTGTTKLSGELREVKTEAALPATVNAEVTDTSAVAEAEAPALAEVKTEESSSVDENAPVLDEVKVEEPKAEETPVAPAPEPAKKQSTPPAKHGKR